ncbi:MAG: D-alanyl-D-alanine carboxypeptidase [Clostridia bacterium]|nr:D-alanyl-D-alanine carboxypeptidase [Clostridia bacterium]
MKKILSVILAVSFLISGIPQISAENSVLPQKQEENNRVKTATADNITKKQENNKDEEKKEVIDEKPPVETEKYPGAPTILSEAAFLLNTDTGKVLYDKNPDKKMYPASTTKIMTAYLVLKRLDLDTAVTASAVCNDVELDGSRLGIIEGETFTVKHLLCALLIKSANDAANVLAEAVSGSVESFVSLMNETAQNFGMTNTNFVNPHGYHDDNHYTTARDMAIISAKAMEIEAFAEIVSSKVVEIPATNKTPEARKFYTRNVLMDIRSSLDLQYQYTNGIKTGNTSKAGQCFVGSAQRNGINLVSVVFKAPENSPNAAFSDTKKLFEYAYSKYRIRTVLLEDDIASTCNVKWSRGKSHLVLKTHRDIKALLNKEGYNAELLTSKINVYEDITAPVKKGDVLGEITYYYDGVEAVSAELHADRDVSRSYTKQILSYLLNIWFLIFLGFVVVIILLRRRKLMRRAARIRRMNNRKAGRK